MELIEKCKELAKNCKNKSEFKKRHPFLYKKCCYEKIIDDVFGKDYSDKYYSDKYSDYPIERILEICLSVTRTEFGNKYQFLKVLLDRVHGIDYKTLEFKPKQKRAFPIKYSVEYITEVTKYMRFRDELESCDRELYSYCKRNGYFKNICSHLKISNGSRPQMIMTYIIDNLLNSIGYINDRIELKPYEIDLYYPQYKLGFEYNGSKWHTNNQNDELKQTKAIDVNIVLLVIHDNDRNNYERDIKSQICEQLKIINAQCGTKITTDDVINVVVNYEDLICYNLETYKAVIEKYSSLREFAQNDYAIYNNLKCLGLLYPMTKNIRRMNGEELLEYSYEICRRYSDFNQFKKENRCHFNRIYKTGDYAYIDFYTKYEYIKNDDIIKYNKSRLFMKNNNIGLFRHVKLSRKELFDNIPKYDNDSLLILANKYDDYSSFSKKERNIFNDLNDEEMKFIRKHFLNSESISEIVKRYDNYLTFKKNEKTIFSKLSDDDLFIVHSYFKNIDYNRYFSLDINLSEIKFICSKYDTVGSFKVDYPKLIKYLRSENLIDYVFPHLEIKSRNNRVRKINTSVKIKY